MRNVIRKYGYLLLACCLMSCSAHSLPERYKKIKQNTIYYIANFVADIASVNSSSGNYTKAVNYFEYQKYLLETLLSQENDVHTNNVYLTDYRLSLTNLGYLYFKIGDYVHAKQYFLEVLENKKDILGQENPSYAIVLNNLADLYSQMGDYEQAERYYLEALGIIKKALGRNHLDYAAVLNNLAVHYFEIGNYNQAEKYYLEVTPTFLSLYGSNSSEYAVLLNNLGVLYFKMGDFLQTEKYYIEALAIRKSVLGVGHIDYITSLNCLGNFYSEVGNYYQSEKYFLEALELSKTALNVDDLYLSRTLSGLGVLYAKIGNYELAKRYFLATLEIRKDVLGMYTPDYSFSLSNLGNLYLEIGDYENAEKVLWDALEIIKTVLGQNHPDYASSLNNLGVYYSNIGDYEQAEKYYLEALEIQKSVLGINHPNYASSLNDLGVYYSNIGDYDQSEKYYLEALEIQKRVLGINHPNYASSLNDLGVYYSSIGDHELANSYLTSSCCIQKQLFLSSLDYMTENQRMQFWKTMQSKFDETYPIFTYKYHFSKPSISTFAYDNELFRKGLLLSSSNIIRQSILGSYDSILIKQWNELVGIKQVIMNLEEKEPTSTNLAHYKNQADSLEKIVTKSSAIFRETKQQQSITWDSIQQYLNPDEVAIEYFIAPLNEDSTMYCALLLRHDSQYPELIPLCEEKEIVNCLSHNQTNDIYTFDTNSKTIFNLIWDKILPQIHEGETIYFSPAGLLHQIAIENIPYDQTHTMSDVYTMVRLSSTREIVKKDKNIKHHTATIYGGIFYDVDKTSLLAESRNYDTEDMFAYRSISSTYPNRGSVLYLPGTKQEAESIHSLLNSNNITSTLYTASKANEESFKSLSGKHRNILHIGTHGFYWEDSTARKQDYFSQRIQLQMLGDNQLQKPSIDPLTRCGLLFAGSNIALSGHSNDLPEGVQDGILTAKEISLMDLRDADLVVLSACETAKGDITSEGIFGLQRAFKMAGVQTIIMSLWKVNDQATQMLMTEFYTNWISKNQSKREAFKNAQNTVRAKFEEPEYWAGFILLD